MNESNVYSLSASCTHIKNVCIHYSATNFNGIGLIVNFSPSFDYIPIKFTFLSSLSTISLSILSKSKGIDSFATFIDYSIY